MRHLLLHLLARLLLLVSFVACAPAFAGWPAQPTYVCGVGTDDLGLPARVWAWLTGGCGTDHLTNHRGLSTL
jgi:hypothetical protein